jgi:hypothetical protein
MNMNSDVFKTILFLLIIFHKSKRLIIKILIAFNMNVYVY